jgi:uncharacterized membrane protein
MSFIKLYLTSLPVFVVIDALWLGIVAKNFYQKHIGHILADKFSALPAIAFYLLFLAGLVFFVISPSMEKKSWTYAVLAGAFFGLVTYATYDLTNMATVKNWPLIVTIVDLFWGMTLGGLVSLLTYLVNTKLLA